VASKGRSAWWLRLLLRRDAARKLAGGAGVEARRRRFEGENPGGDVTPGEHRAGRRLTLAASQRTRTGEQSLEATHAATGSADRSTWDWPVPRAARRAAESRSEWQEGRENVERRSGSGRGKSSVGEGTPRALRHETRPGRLSRSKPSRGCETLGTERTGRGKPGSEAETHRSGLDSWTVL